MQGNVDNISRLEKLLAAIGISQRTFAAETGLSTSVISHYATGEREITSKSALKIQKAYPSVNINWLLTGEGSMWLPDGVTVPTVAAEPNQPYYTEKDFRDLLDRIEAMRQDLERERKINSELSEAILNLTKPK